MTRTCKSYSKHPPKFRSSPLPGATIPQNGAALDHFVSDMSEPKRVKFAHPQATQVPRWDAPKTSEYAFFKKLKKDIGGNKSRPLHKEDIHSKITKANTEISTYCSTSKCNSRNLRSSSGAEKEGPSNQFSFLSPIGLESNILGTPKDTSCGINQRSSLLSGNVVSFDQNLLLTPFAGAAKNLENQYAEKEEVFAVKRRRLRQLAADLFPEARECSARGFDLVSALISRLLPRGNETEYSSTKERKIDAEHHSPAFAQLDTLEKTSPRNASKIQDASCWDDVFPKYQSGRTRERILSTPRGNETEYSRSKERKIDAEHHSLAFAQLDALEKTSPRNASKIQDGSCWDDVFPKNQSGRTRERILSTPWGNETEYSISKGRIVDAEYPSPAFLKLDTVEKTSARNVSNIRDGSCWDDVFPKYQSGRPRERGLSKWDMTTSNLPCTEYNAESDFHDEEANYSCAVDGNNIQYMFPERDSSLCVLFENCRYSEPDHMEQLLGFHTPNEPARGEARTLLLSWDVKEDKETNSYSAPGNSLDFAWQQIMDDNHEETTTCSSTLCLNHSLDFLSRSCFCSTCTCMHGMGRNHEDDYMVAEADVFPLSLSLPPKYLTMGEDSDIVNHFENNNINLHEQNPPWCTSKVTGKKGDLEALLFSRGLDIGLGWRCLPKSDFLANYESNYHIFQFPFEEDLCSYAVGQDEGTSLYCLPIERTLASSDGLDILNWSSATFSVSLGKMIGQSLLLEYPGRV